MDSSTDFEELSARMRTQSEDAAGSDTERVTIRSLEEVSYDGIKSLLEVYAVENTDTEDLVLVLSSLNAELVFETDEADIDDTEDLEDRLGHEVRVEEGMPEDTILLLDPDAVSGEEILEPENIVCGMVGAADEPDE
ncbi:hypothetical protein [Halostagnicola sp. A-GB9-2]|uniref:hypothetical protein n=1 Tax=Halostagnicola sp. A-GB9-2 TaxID=3048066 RepID=UPI0024BF4B98|nr:hypothetical protein [Halostagnicola sp. A-GB9-2]MDJ1432205.1 hypothetical protein [Halostagnicola sp. A-GB9-2]